MEHPVLDGGHFAFLYGFHHFIEFAGIRVPIGKVKFVPAFVHVKLDQPGGRGDVAIPGPFGFVAVTLEAMFLGECARFGT